MKTTIHTALLLATLSLPCLALAWGCSTAAMNSTAVTVASADA